MAKGFTSYGIIIVGHFCRGMTIYVSFLEQDITEETRALKIFNDLQVLFEIVYGRSIASFLDSYIFTEESIAERTYCWENLPRPLSFDKLRMVSKSNHLPNPAKRGTPFRKGRGGKGEISNMFD